MNGTVHIIGAGLAGLSAALKLTERGRSVVVHEATAFAGGRCRSYHDAAVGMTIDNGNHLLLSGNHAALAYLRDIGAADRLVGPAHAEFPFVDLASGERWTLRFNDGRLPFWIFDTKRRVPGTRVLDYLPLARLLRAAPGHAVGDVIACDGVLYKRLVEPLLLAALNIDPPLGAARLASAVIRETLATGGRACRPLIAREGLGATLIEPALAHLQQHGAVLQLEHQLRGLRLAADKVEALDFGGETIALAEDDAVILAVPPYVAAPLVKDLVVPTEFRAIVNAHFRIAPPAAMPQILGVLNGTVEWIFAFPGRVSVTISAGDRLVDGARDVLAKTIWSEVAAATGLPADLPPWQIVRERRATFAATPEQDAKRPGAATQLAQFCAGRRLDRHRPAGNNRRRDPLRQSRRRRHREAALMDDKLTQSIESATEALLARQRADGHWVFELEADATIPAEYVLLRHYLGEPVDAALEQKIAVYLRRIQGAHGGWPLFADGDLDVSATVKAYFALKMIGDPIDAEHMRRAREAVLARGGAARANVFTRIMLALFGFIPWRAVPVMPIEIMLLPKWFPFHLDKISYWSRTVIVPLLVLMAKKPRARNAKGVRIDELFLEPPHTIGPTPKAPQQKTSWFWFFRGVDNVLRAIEPYFPKRTRQRAFDNAVAWVTERLNGEDGLGAIFPAMANSVMMFDVLGYPENHPQRAIARQSIEKLLAVHEHEAYCQPCVSPIWDTGLVCHALLEVGGERATAEAKRGLDWLTPKQILDVRGDWIARRPDLRPGGWAFQYANAHYPDVDDTAVVAMAMDRVANLSGAKDFDASLVRAKEWILGMQSANGAWGAFDADNEFYYLNNIPFADHGALLDPPTEDVTARCLSMLAQFGETAANSAAVARAIDYLRRTQLAEGSWYGRWGMNYIYGTWSVLSALNAAGVDHAAPEMRKAANWLVAIQNEDDGWGEDGSSYKLDYKGYERAPSTASQTAWALLGLMASGDVDHPAVERGIAYLTAQQGTDGFWNEPRYTATGFPRVFYLRYHGYSKFFPLWALARYRNLKSGNARAVAFGM